MDFHSPSAPLILIRVNIYFQTKKLVACKEEGEEDEPCRSKRFRNNVINALCVWIFRSKVINLLCVWTSVMKFNPIPDGILCHCVGSLSPEGHASRHTAPRDKIYQKRLYFYLPGSQNVSRSCCLKLIRNISKNAESSSSCSSRTGQSLDSPSCTS